MDRLINKLIELFLNQSKDVETFEVDESTYYVKLTDDIIDEFDFDNVVNSFGTFIKSTDPSTVIDIQKGSNSSTVYLTIYNSVEMIYFTHNLFEYALDIREKYNLIIDYNKLGL